MMVLPSESDLVAFFGCQPALESSDAPREYNKLKFCVDRLTDSVLVTLYPPSGELILEWRNSGVPRVLLRLNGVRSIGIEAGISGKVLIASRPDECVANLIKLRLDPFVAVESTSWVEAQ